MRSCAHDQRAGFFASSHGRAIPLEARRRGRLETRSATGALGAERKLEKIGPASREDSNRADKFISARYPSNKGERARVMSPRCDKQLMIARPVRGEEPFAVTSGAGSRNSGI